MFRNRLDSESKTALFRIAQEALTNIERHAQAQSVRVVLRGTKQGAVMRISDDGIGIKRRGQATGLGLRNMQERVDQLQGNLFIDTDKTGTTVEVIVPLTHMLPPKNHTKMAEAAE